MNETCLHVQDAISRAADGDRVTAEEAALAKRHCAECAECATFARVLVAMKRTEHPAVPPHVVDRALAAVHEQRQSDKLEAARALAAERAAAAADAGTDAPLESSAPSEEPAARRRFISLSERDARGTEVVRVGRRIMSQQRFVGLVASAAVLLVAIVIVADQGVRFMGNAGVVNEEVASDLRAADDGMPIEAPATTQSQESLGTAPDVAGVFAQYVVIDGFAYRYTGLASGASSELTRTGTVRTALDTGGSPSNRTVYAGPSEQTIIVEGADALLAFTLVTRSLGGQLYGLTAEPIESFGMWPSLPRGTSEPTELDGSPTFSEAGTDDAGVTVFTKSGRSATGGFAVAPGTPSADPAGGNPGWTWWTPLE